MELNQLYQGDCLTVMRAKVDDNSVDLIYLDPPFFTDKVMGETWKPGALYLEYDDSKRFWASQDIIDSAPVSLKELGKEDPGFAKYLMYMRERLIECKRCLKNTGSVYLHCDWRASHYLKIIMDEIFGYENFKNEIVWWYGGGGASKKYFARKHDIILFYSKSNEWTFNVDSIREPYSKEWLGTPRADGSIRDFAKGKLPDDVIKLHGVLPMENEREGYPTQKPKALLKEIIKASSNYGDIVMDPFMGGGTTIKVASSLKRKYIGIDVHGEALAYIKMEAEKIGEQRLINELFEIVDMTKVDGFEFQKWVINKYGWGKMPMSGDGGVDAITKEGVPVQIKSTKIGKTELKEIIGKMLDHADERIKKPINTMIVVAPDFTVGKESAEEYAGKLRNKDKDKLNVILEKEKVPNIEQLNNTLNNYM